MNDEKPILHPTDVVVQTGPGRHKDDCNCYRCTARKAGVHVGNTGMTMREKMESDIGIDEENKPKRKYIKRVKTNGRPEERIIISEPTEVTEAPSTQHSHSELCGCFECQVKRAVDLHCPTCGAPVELRYRADNAGTK